MLERRRYMRFDTKMDVEYKVPDQTISGMSTTKDFSREGLRLYADRLLASGTELELKVILPSDERPVLARGQVVWSAPNSQQGASEAGIRLTQIERFDRARVLDFVYNRWLTTVIRTR